MTAREALSALSPAEEGRESVQEDIQLSQKKLSPDFSTELAGNLAPAGRSFHHEGYRTNDTSWSPNHSRPISSIQPAATVDGLDQAASLKSMAGSNTNQSGSCSRVYLPLVHQTTNSDVMNTCHSSVSNNGNVILSSKPHEAEDNCRNSNFIPRIMNSSLDNVQETSQAETRYYSSTAQNSAQVSQALNPPNHQPPFANRVNYSPSNQSCEGTNSHSDSDVISEDWYFGSENSESSNNSDRAVNSPHVAANPRNPSQDSGDSQLPFERRFSQSFSTTETTAQQPPPRTTDQDRDTQTTRLGPPGPPPPSGRPPISPQRSFAFPPPPPASPQNAWPNGPPPPPPRRAPNINQSPPPALPPPGPPPPPVSPENRWSNAPPPASSRAPYQNLGPPPPPIFQNAWPNSPPPPPRRAFNQNQGPPGPPPISPQNSSAPPPPPPPLSQNAWPNGPPPPPPRALYQNQPPPPPSLSPQYQRPPSTPPSVQCQNPRPSPAEGPPSSLAASTQYQSPYPTNASIPVAGPPSHQFQSSGQQQPSSSPWYSAQYIGLPPPTPAQNRPVDPPFVESGSASGVKSPSSTTPIAGLTSAMVWKKYNEIVLIHVPFSVQTDANLIDTGPRGLATRVFPAEDVLKQTVVGLFRWISGLLNTGLPSQLVFEFMNVHSNVESRVILCQGDSKILETVKSMAWQLFLETARMDLPVATVNILIMPRFSTASGNRHENMQQQSQKSHSANTASTIPSDQPSYLSLPNQSGSSIASDSIRRPPTIESGGPPPLGPPPQSQSSSFRSLASDTIKPHGGPLQSAPSSMPIPHNKTTPESNVPNSNNKIAKAHPPSNPDLQRQPQQQPAQVPAPNNPNTDNSHPTAKIVIRLQVDGHGRLSRSYDKSTLSTRITSTRFFAWFAQETGHTGFDKLRFDFKDALPAKTSVIEAGNDDHFDLMVCDIKRKFERAKNFAPDLNEFCIVVTDPLWNSDDEDDDE